MMLAVGLLHKLGDHRLCVFICFQGSGFVAITLAHLLNVIETSWSQRLPKLRVKRLNVDPFYALAGQPNTILHVT